MKRVLFANVDENMLKGDFVARIGCEVGANGSTWNEELVAVE